MSVVSSRSTSIASILSGSDRRHRQLQKQSAIVYIAPRNLKKILVNYEMSNDRKTYEGLVVMLRDASISDTELINLLKDVRECISLLTMQHRLLLEALLNVPWTARGLEATAAYRNFLEDLVCVHVYHCKAVIDRLVLQLKPEDGAAEWEDNVPRPGDLVRLENIHSVLERVLRIVPMASNLLIQSVTSKFPYFKASTAAHQVFVFSLLQISRYAPELRSELLSLIINRLIILDVNAPRSEIEGYGEEDEDEEEEGEEMFEMEAEPRQKKVHPVGHTLDVCLNGLFDFIRSVCYPGGQLDPDGVKGIYFDLLPVFEKSILPTYACHHVQFIIFYFCSFKFSIVEAFVNCLWGKVSNPNVAPVIRQSAACYLVSLMARGSFVSIGLIIRVISEMTNWIHSYIAAQDGLECANSDVRVHTVFYAICQALFYVIAFRHKDLVDTKKHLLFLQSLNLTKIVTCHLNPLKFCLPVVVQHFAAVTRAYQLAYCYTVIEHNARSNLPVLQKTNRLTTWLDTFFPFDPYVLPKSSTKIAPIYLQYQGNVSVDDEAPEPLAEEENDEDDFMDVSFPRADAKSHLDKFSYSTSPGFIHS